MQNFEKKGMHTDVKRRIDDILENHKIATESISKENPNNVDIYNDFNSHQDLSTVDREIKLDPSRTIMSKTDPRGIIEFANDYFMEICGYEEYELMGQPHNIIRHPDMPKIVFKLMWNRLNKGGNIHALVKNLAKDGRYYWVLTNFETKYDDEGIIVSHYARRKAAPGNAIYQVEKLYKTLRSIEKTQNMEVAERYFFGMLEEKGLTYDEFILNALSMDKQGIESYFSDAKPSQSKNKKSLIKRLFG